MKQERTRGWLALGRTATDGLVAPVAQLILASRPRVFAISGPVGAGKSTLAGAVSRSLADAGVRAVALSLDDFYLSRVERERRGIRWRAAPGSHDLDLMARTLAAIQDGTRPLVLPRFDHAEDDRSADERLDVGPDIVLFEGWLVGYDGQGYDRMFPFLDWHLHLDVPKDVARGRRFSREGKLRDETGRGFSEEHMQAFWDEVLGPGIDTLVPVTAQHADIVVRLTDAGLTCLAEPRLDEFLPD